MYQNKRWNIECDLSVADIEALSKDLHFLADNFDKINTRFLQLSGEFLKEHAIQYIRQDIGSGTNLETQFQIILKDDLVELINMAGYSAFVEYGTGIIGANSPHPEVPDGWIYDVNGYAEKGWFYFDDELQQFSWTKGQTAKAFMYKSLVDYFTYGYKDCFKRALEEAL